MSCSPTVFIVEDEAAIVMALEMTLDAAGFQVCGSASSKDEAITGALDTHPTFIIIDIRLSGESDGIEAAEEIQRHLNETRFIFITGYSEGEVRTRAMALNPLAYIVKPFQVSQLISLMNRHLS